MMGDAPKLRAAVIIISETANKDPSSDKCIPALQDVFANEGGGRFDVKDTLIVTDDVLQIQRAITQRTDGEDFVNLIVTSGGTGFTQKDVTPEVCSSGPSLFPSCLIKSDPKSREHSTQSLAQIVTEFQAVTTLIHKHAPGLV